MMGPVLDSRDEEIFHASAHGLVAWAIAVVMTATMIAVSGLALAGPGLNAAALLGAANQTNQGAPSPTDVTGYWVDMLFRPASGAVQPNLPATAGAGSPATANIAPAAAGGARTEAEAHAEAGRILAVSV